MNNYDKISGTLRPNTFGNKRISDDIIQPVLRKLGSPANVGLAASITTMPLAYVLLKMMKSRHAGAGALGAAALTGAAFAGATNTGKKGEEWVESVSPSAKPYWQREIEAMRRASAKTASDNYNEAASQFGWGKAPWALPQSSKDVLYEAVNTVPSFTTNQRIFLMDGISNAPTHKPDLFDVASGFEQTVGKATGGLLPMATRAIEGAIIGSAFSHVMGLQPGAKAWATGLAALGDALYGNRLLNVYK